VSLKPSLLQAEQPQLSQPFHVGEVFHPSNHFCGTSLDSLQQVHIFPVLRAPELDAGFQVCSHKSRCYGFVWQGFGSGGAIGVASVRSSDKLPPCLIKPVLAGHKMDLPLPKAKPISDSGSASEIT